jgi:hypothetical protein
VFCQTSSYYETSLDSGLFVLRWRFLFYGGAVHLTATASLRHVPDELPAAPHQNLTIRSVPCLPNATIFPRRQRAIASLIAKAQMCDCIILQRKCHRGVCEVVGM